MASIQPHTHSFIVKVWLAAPEDRSSRHAWCGRITHVPSGRHRHVLKLPEVTDFITPYLQQLGVRPTLLWRLTRWVRR